MVDELPTLGDQDPFDWHRLLGLLLREHFAGSPYDVELEMELARKKQYLDIIVIRRDRTGETRPLPDGFDGLVDHNLVTFKSQHEPLDDWALKELTGHYVNYRKIVSGREALVPEASFRLMAVAARWPRELFRIIPPQKVQDGVYDCSRGSDTFRIIVVGELPKTPNNAMLHLFSAAEDRVQYGCENYRVPSNNAHTLIHKVIDQHTKEGFAMPYTMEDFKKALRKEVLSEMTPEELLREVPAEKLIRGLPPEELTKRLTPEQRLAGLSADEIEAVVKKMRQAEATTAQ